MSSYRNFVFTINNPTHGPTFEEWMSYLVYQGEMGENGTFHFQGYCEIDKGQKSLKQLKEWEPRAHFERRRGTQRQAIDYCTKEDTRIEGPFIEGEPKHQGARADRVELFEMVKAGKTQREIADLNPSAYMGNYKAIDRLVSMNKPTARPREVRLLYGEPGTGKTRYVLDRHPNAYVIPVTTTGGLWFDGYDGHDVALIDDFDGQIPLIQFLRVLHEYPEQLPIKGGFVWWNPSIIYITSNYTIRHWYEGKDGTGWNNREPSYHALERRISQQLFFPLQMEEPEAAQGQGDGPEDHLGEMGWPANVQDRMDNLDQD